MFRKTPSRRKISYKDLISPYLHDSETPSKSPDDGCDALGTYLVTDAAYMVKRDVIDKLFC